MNHTAHAPNESTVKISVILALLLFFGLTIAGQMVFVGGDGEPGEHFVRSDDGDSKPVVKETATPKAVSKKKHH